VLSTNKKEWILEDLDCANCAAKIEKEISELKYIKTASVDFVSKRLVIEAEENTNLNEISEQIIKIINKIEPDVRVVSKNKEKTFIKEESSKKEIIIIALGALSFTIGLVLDLSSQLEFAIFLISYIILGGDIVLKALKNLLRGVIFDESFLMSIATIGAFAIGNFPEGVAVMLFYKVGELFQDLAVNRSRKSISELMDIRPDFANLKVDNKLKVVSPEDVKIGDIIVVKPGEKVPLDGKVIDGNSMADTCALTGESIPREVIVGDNILSGFINISGILTIEVTKEFGESTVSKILDLVQNASIKKATTENFITKFARYYTPVVVIAAIIIALIPPLVMQGEIFSDWIYRALVFLVISCPCALVVSIPLGFFGGIGGASRQGILIKGSNYLEALNNVETVVFDKTGTLTMGVFNVTQINSQNGYTNEELIEYAAYAESYSNHPIALSVLKSYGKKIDLNEIESYEEIGGHGIKVITNGKKILVGNSKLMIKENIDYCKVESFGTEIHVSLNDVYVGYIVISDELKDDSKNVIKALKHMGIKKTVMLTGDNKNVGEKIGNSIGIDEVYTELLPDQKVEKLELLNRQKTTKGNIIFIGDGINDAPVLARADVGIAMGGLGSDAAIEASDIVIMTDEPIKIVTAIKIAKRTRKIVLQNICFAIGIKVLFLGFGALGVASMWEAVFADVGVSIIAIVNAMRAIKVDNI
jgi:Cd2+/Zn2+-exporting ATPase